MKTRTSKRLLAVLLSVLLVAELIVTGIVSTVAETDTPQTKTVTKELLDFSETTVSTDNIRTDTSKWPAGLEKMDDTVGGSSFKFGFTGNVQIAEDTDGEKFIKFIFSEQINNTTNAVYPNRVSRGNIYVKASVPYWYVKYLKNIELDYVYNYETAASGISTADKKKENLFKGAYVLGISNGSDKLGKTNVGSSGDYSEVLAPSADLQSGTVSKQISDMFVASDTSAIAKFDKDYNYSSADKWTSDLIGEQSKVDVVLMFGAPKVMSGYKDSEGTGYLKKGYYFGIKGISIELEGPSEEIDNIDNEEYVNESILSFEEGTTVEEITSATANTVKFTVSKKSELSSDAYKGDNALLYAAYKGGSSTSTVQYDSNMNISLKRDVVRSKGITFMAKNLGDKSITYRIWIAVGNDTGTNASKGKYQAFVTVPANQTEYARYSIYWDNVGLMSFDSSGEWWGGSSAGNAIMADELASGLRLSFKYPSGTSDEFAGVLFDEFEYITNKFISERSATLVDFSNTEEGGDLPDNMEISGNYGGTTEIIENADGSKSLKLNYDKEAAANTSQQMNQLVSRKYYKIKISVPRGALHDIASIDFDVTNNIADYDTTAASTATSVIQYNFGVGDTTNSVFGKTDETNGTVKFTGNKVITQKPVGMFKVGEYNMTAWAKPSVHWSEEDVKDLNAVYMYISAPDCDGTEGWNFQINSVKLLYNEPVHYDEESSREIVRANEAEKLTSGKIAITSVDLEATDPYRCDFVKATEVNVKKASNTERIVYKNGLSEYYRNATAFYDKGTANIHMFYKTDSNVKLDVILIDKNAVELKTQITLNKCDSYSEATADFKEIYDSAVADDPDFAFDMTDIREIALLPVVSKAVKFNIANVALLTEAYVSNMDDGSTLAATLLNFEEGMTLEEITTNTASTVKFSVTTGGELSGDAYEGNNALLYKSAKGEGSFDYDTNMSLRLNRDVNKSKGVTFMVKNLGDKAVTYRIWIKVGNDTGANASKGKYQYVFTVPANQTEYQRVSVYWNNVGLMSFDNGGEWWAGSTSGSYIMADELASGLTLSIKYGQGADKEAAGVLFDNFEYITKEFVEARTVTVVDFSNSAIGSETPENVTVTGTYEGSTKIVQNADGTKSLRLNYDAPAAADTNSELHHMRSRLYYRVNIAVPRGALDDVSEMTVNMTNNIADYNTSAASTATEKIHYNIGIGDTTNALFGKSGEINSYVGFTGSTAITQKPVGYLQTSSYGMISWVDKNSTKWTAEDMKNVDMIYFYVSAPDCDGTEGWSFQLDSVTLTYNEPSEYNEEATREITHSDKVQSLTSGKITAKSLVVGTTDPNSAEFGTAFEVEVKNKANTERIVLKNELSEYYRNMTPFYNKGTVNFHMFALADEDLTFKVALIDKNGAELPTQVTIKATTTKLYSEASVDLKEAYDAALAADPDFSFDMSDIRSVALLPVVSKAVKFKIAGVSVLTGEYLSSEDDASKQKTVNLVNFDNCEVGSKGEDIVLPSNVSVSGYAGTQEIVRTADGSNALQVNYDVLLTNSSTSETHQTNRRTNIVVKVTVPKGSLTGLKKIKYTLTNNGFKLSEQTGNLQKNYYTVAATTEDGIFVKQGESASAFSGQKGVTSSITLDLSKGITGSGSYYITSWFNKANALEYDEKYTSEFVSILLYIAVPDIDTQQVNKGMNFQINSIDLEFDSKPTYAGEDATRYVVNGTAREMESTNESTITATQVKLASNNINYRSFNNYYTIEAKKGNTAAVAVDNSLSTFLRSVEPFTDTATFRMYYQTSKATNVDISLVNFNGEKITFTAKLKASKSDKFDEYSVSFKSVYNAYLKANPNAKFSLSNLTGVEILPSGTGKLNVASIGLWSMEAGSAGSAGNYYYALPDDSVRVEAYNNNITEDFKVTIEHLDPETTFAEFGTRLPEDSTTLALVKITLRNGLGEMVQPAGRFWVSIRLPEGTDLTNVKLYEVFYDGSLVPIKRVVMDANNYISCEDYFATKTYAVMIVPPTEEVIDEPEESGGDETPSEETEGGEETPTEPQEETTESTLPAEDEYYYYEYEVVIPGEEGEYVETPSQQTIIKRYKKIKKSVSTDYTWLWITIGVGSGILLIAAGVIVFIIIRKKRKAATPEGDVTQ